MRQRSLFPVAALAAAILVPGGLAMAADGATVPLKSVEGGDVGTVTLQPAAFPGLIVTLEATALPPGVHAFHLHETGSCDPATGFKSAGGHFNPTKKAHGWLNEKGAHLGDLPNIHVPETGALTQEFFIPGVSLVDMDGAEALLDDDGAAVVIHAGVDDYKSDPAGDAGERIACGVIEAN